MPTTILHLAEVDLVTGKLLDKSQVILKGDGQLEIIPFQLTKDDEFDLYISTEPNVAEVFGKDTHVFIGEESADLTFPAGPAIHLLSIYHELNRTHFIYSNLAANIMPTAQWPKLTVEVPNRTENVTSIHQALQGA